MSEIELKAQERTVLGKKVKNLRKNGFVPGVIYGHNFKPLNIQVGVKDFQKAYSQAGESTLLYLAIDSERYPTIIKDLVRDPVGGDFMHADFYKVRLDEKIHANIPLVYVGEPPAVKDFGGILVKNINELEVEGFPQDLPHEITVDVSGLKELNSHITIGDLKFSDKLEISANPEDIVALVQEPISEEQLQAELETPTASAEDVEVIKKEKPEAETEESDGEPAA